MGATSRLDCWDWPNQVDTYKYDRSWRAKETEKQLVGFSHFILACNLSIFNDLEALTARNAPHRRPDRPLIAPTNSFEVRWDEANHNDNTTARRILAAPGVVG